MSRDIKFRAWWPSRSEMMPPMTLVEIAESETMTVPDEILFMQYTGLKDKNGVEIYEGDIVRSISEEDGENILEVMWHQFDRIGSGFSFVNPDTADDDYYHDTIEVIGNVYENRDLLTKSAT